MLNFYILHQVSPSLDSQEHRLHQAAPPKQDEDSRALMSRDLIWLQHGEKEFGALLTGDSNQRIAEVQTASAAVLGDGIFRICSRFSYRAKIEVRKIVKTIAQSNDPAQMEGDLNLDLAKKWAASEEEHNAELLEQLSTSLHVSVDEDGTILHDQEPIKFGDIVQFQHVSSGLFLAMHKTPAPLSSTCRRVSLKAGSFAAHFKVLPRFIG